jgi:hypothetical protein
MRRTPTVVTSASLLLLTLAAAAPGVAAQVDAMSSADHPLVGTWIVDSTPDDPTDPLEVVVVGSGGTLLDTSLDGIGSGAWSPTGDRSADVTFVFPAADPEAGFIGFVTVRSSVEVADDGLSFSGTYTLEPPAAMAEAMGMTPGELGPGDVSAQRIVVEPMGEVVGPIPPEPDASAEEAMPEESPAA